MQKSVGVLLSVGLSAFLAAGCGGAIKKYKLRQRHLYTACEDQPKTEVSRAEAYRTAEPVTAAVSSLSAVEEGLRTELVSKGYAVDDGALYFFQKEDCENLSSCYGNNPASPYGLFMLPAREADLATSAVRLFTKQGRVPAWHLGRDEAVVFLGRTPPRAAYFGITPYLFDRKGKELFASLGDTLNQKTIRVAQVEGQPSDGAFGAPTMIVQAANKVVADAVVEASVKAGFPREAINLQVIPHSVTQLGLSTEDDLLMSLLRVAYVDDREAGQRYLTSPDVSVMRIRPPQGTAFEALVLPPLRVGGGGSNEETLRAKFVAFEQALLQEHPNADSECMFELRINGPDCIEGNYRCIGDNQDTPYLIPIPRELAADEVMVVYGVRHDRSGLATYVNLSVTELSRAVGVASVGAEEFAGSAKKYVPKGDDADAFFVYRFARDCAGYTHCFEIKDGPTAAQPPAIPISNKMLVVWRAYLQAVSATAPLLGDMIPPRYFVTKRSAR